MLSTPMDVLHRFEIRKTKPQKQAFRDAVQDYAQKLGYIVNIEKGKGAENVIIGNPLTAKYLITAHYDTCPRSFFPNMVTPFNFAFYILYQLLIVAGFFAVAGLVSLPVYLITKDDYIAFVVAMAVYWLQLILMMFGPANKHTANDNTSGVVTLLEIARTLPEKERSKVCFILFDLEEVGLVGSAAYRKAHKTETDRQIVLNLDCVGDGDTLHLIPNKKVLSDTAMMEKLSSIQGDWGEKSIRVHRKGFSMYPSDQKHFPLGVAIGAFHHHKLLGYYYSRIHTNRDTVLDMTNVNILRAALITLVCGDTK